MLMLTVVIITSVILTASANTISINVNNSSTANYQLPSPSTLSDDTDTVSPLAVPLLLTALQLERLAMLSKANANTPANSPRPSREEVAAILGSSGPHHLR